MAQENDRLIFAEKIYSPDKNYEFSLSWATDAQGKKKLSYHLNYKNQTVILESELALEIDNHLIEAALAKKQERLGNWLENLHFTEKKTRTVQSNWKPVYGERSEVKDHYNEVIFSFQKPELSSYQLELIVRAYDEGVAFAYHFIENTDNIYFHIKQENSSFTLPEGTKAWFTPHAQGEYRLLPLKEWEDEGERPLTLELENGWYVCLAEAAMVDYARTKFKLSDKKENTLLTSIYSSIDLISPFTTPWRVIMVGEKPGDLIENNFIIQNLNKECAIEDTSWIKPGKIIREMTLTTEGAVACIDFAAEHMMQYILFDWKWYGPAFTFESDARTVEVDLDMKKVVEYGEEKGVGVWLYVNQQALYKQLDQIFPLYKEWGIKGVKFGFVQTGSQFWSTWLHHAVRVAAENELMVNIHDEYRPTGYARTYPNLLTIEGIRGNEEFPAASHNTILPFTRMIAGAGDYTVCYYDPRMVTRHGHQLALGVVMYSPLQTLFWYDLPQFYEGEKEVAFFEKLPVTWDETRVIGGRPGEYAAIARRAGQDWFVGIINGDEERELVLSFDFLPEGETFHAKFYSDEPSLNTRTNIKIETIHLQAQDSEKIKLFSSGGLAIWLRKS